MVPDPPLVVMVALYATATWPFGRFVVTIVRGGATVIDIVCKSLTGGVEESVTFATKVKVPTDVVVPLTVPSLARLRPVGSEPPKKLNVKGAVPVRTVMSWLYATPGLAVGRTGFTVTGCTTAKTKVCVALRGGVLLSVTCTVKVEAPIAVAVPDSSPDALRVMPVGGVPEVSDQTRLPTPPFCWSCSV